MPIGLGLVSTAGVAELIAKTYDDIFVSLRNTDPTIKKLLFPETKEGNDKIRFHLDGNDKNPVRSISETQMNSLINATILDTTTGSGAQVGGAFLTPNLHPVIEAELDLRNLVQTIMIGAKQLAAIKGGKDSFQNILTRTTEKSLQDWTRGIDDQLISFGDTLRTGSGAPTVTTDLDGLQAMLAIGSPSPGYALVNYTTYPEFKPYVSHNTGTPRALTIALMQDMWNKLMAAPAGQTRRYAKTDMILCGAAQFTAYGNLLTAQRRWTGTETMDAGFKTLEFNGIKVVSVPEFDATKMLWAQKTTRDGEKSYEYRVLKNYDVSDKSDNIVGGILYICLHMANALCKGRMQQGVLMDLS